jgi:hypothetical protein
MAVEELVENAEQVSTSRFSATAASRRLKERGGSLTRAKVLNPASINRARMRWFSSFLAFTCTSSSETVFLNPLQVGRPVDPRTSRYSDLLHREGVPFWPDAVFGLLVIGTVVVLAITIGPPALGRPPNPSIIQAFPQPEWYFLWYYALLSVIPRWSETYVIILGP